MKLNYDCVRSILLEVEKRPRFDDDMKVILIPVDEIYSELEKYSPQEIVYCLEAMKDSGLLIVDIHSSGDAVTGGVITRITHKGHEFLDSVRDLKFWGQLKKILTKVGAITVDIIIETAKALAISKIEIN